MIVIDVETTGEIPERHSILSVGALDFSNPKNQFYVECRMRRDAKIDPVALKRNGFSREEITSNKKDSLKSAMIKLLRWSSSIEDTTFAGCNHHMDVGFIEHSLRINRLKNPFKYRLVDTHTLTFADYLKRGLKPPLKDRGSDINSGRTLEYCGLPEEPMPHNALTGAKIEAEAISRLIYGRNLLEEYAAFPIPRHLKRYKFKG